MAKTAILLHNLGGPASEEECYTFLLRLFSDPEILRLPLSKLLQKPLARFIAKRRAPESWKNYELIGGRSPVLPWTERQGQGMLLGLREQLPDEQIRVLPAMRYSEPLVRDALDTARGWGADRLLSFTMYPQFSVTSTGSSEREMKRCLDAMGWSPEVCRVSEWHDDPGYLDCMAWRVRRAVEKLPKEHRDATHVVYSAHGTPMVFAREGDPYTQQIEATVAGIEARLEHGLESSLAYQSKVGPAKWTQPYLIGHLQSLAEQGVRSVLIVAVAFVSDHVETLFELDIEVKEQVVAAGIEHYTRAPALNADPDFLAVLTNLAAQALGATVSPLGSDPKGDTRTSETGHRAPGLDQGES